MKTFGLSVILTGALASPVVACDLCSIYSASMANGGAGRGLFGGIAENYTYFGTLQDSGQKIPNDGEYIKSLTSQLFAGYNFSDRFSLQFNIPIIYRAFGSDAAQGTESGIGDVSLLGNFTAVQLMDVDYTFNWTLLGGVKFPTGDPNELGQPDFSAGIGGHDLALGSGSYDGIVGTGLFGRWKRLFMNASVQYAIRSEGAFQHQYANDLTWNGGPGVYVALQDEYTLSLQAVVSGEYKGKDTFAGVPDDDSAETIVYLGPQINFTWGARVSVQAGVDLPVSIYNTGVQVVPNYRAHAALTLRF
jgi:hypothetical protein